MPSFYVNSKFYVKEIKGKYYVYSIEKVMAVNKGIITLHL